MRDVLVLEGAGPTVADRFVLDTMTTRFAFAAVLAGRGEEQRVVQVQYRATAGRAHRTREQGERISDLDFDVFFNTGRRPSGRAASRSRRHSGRRGGGLTWSRESRRRCQGHAGTLRGGLCASVMPHAAAAARIIVGSSVLGLLVMNVRN